MAPGCEATHAAPAVAGFIHLRKRSAIEIRVNQRRGEGVSGADCVGHFDGGSRMPIEAIRRHQQAAIAAHGDGDQLQRIFLKQPSRWLEQARFAGGEGFSGAQHRQYLRYFNFVELEDRGQGQRLGNQISALKKGGRRFTSKTRTQSGRVAARNSPNSCSGHGIPLCQGAEANCVGGRSQRTPLRGPLHEIPGSGLMDDVMWFAVTNLDAHRPRRMCGIRL